MAAGLGTRLLPLTRFLSKPMVPVLDLPLMDHLLRLLRGHGFTDLAANLHYQPFDMPQCFDDGTAAGVSLRYKFELELSGTAGGTGLFRDFLSDGAFLVMSGDALTDIDLSGLVAHHRAAGQPGGGRRGARVGERARIDSGPCGHRGTDRRSWSRCGGGNRGSTCPGANSRSDQPPSRAAPVDLPRLRSRTH